METGIQMTDDHRNFLNDLRRSGATNMFGAGAFLASEFGLGRHDANTVLGQWMKSFDPSKDA